jgi:hypothetical protein
MAHWKTGLAALGIAALVATAGLAQTGAGPKDQNMPDAKNVPAEKVAPPLDTSTTGSTGGNLSKRLENSEGVIKPPPTGDDNQVRAPVPNPNSTPVIRPPGSSAADPIQPK